MPIYMGAGQLKKAVIKIMLPERLEFLNRFDKFYQVIINAVKEDKVNERDFYALIKAKCKSMEKERLLMLSKEAK